MKKNDKGLFLFMVSLAIAVFVAGIIVRLIQDRVGELMAIFCAGILAVIVWAVLFRLLFVIEEKTRKTKNN
ncbi:MAG: hypothetical protein WBC21_01770 [Minisyncoccales bacterium]